MAVMMLAAIPQYSSAQNADLLLDGTIIAGCPEQHRKEGDNHVRFHAGTNPKYYCIKNVKITDESAD